MWIIKWIVKFTNTYSCITATEWFRTSLYFNSNLWRVNNSSCWSLLRMQIPLHYLEPSLEIYRFTLLKWQGKVSHIYVIFTLRGSQLLVTRCRITRHSQHESFQFRLDLINVWMIKKIIFLFRVYFYSLQYFMIHRFPIRRS